MLTPGSLRAINICYSWSTKLCIIPFKWDSKLYQFSRASPYHIRITKICAGILWSHLAFTIFRIFQCLFFKEIYMKNTPMKFIIVQILEMVRLSMGCIMQYIFLTKTSVTMSYLNSVIGFNVKLIDKYGNCSKQSKKSDRCQKLMQIFIIVPIVQTIISTLGYIRNPYTSKYFLYFLSNSMRIQYGAYFKPIFIFMFFFDSIIYWTVVIAKLYVMCISGFGSSSWLKEITNKNNPKRRTVLSILQYNISLKIYKCLQLINNDFNSVYSSLGMPTLQLCLLLMDVFPLFLTVRLNGLLPIIEFVRIPIRATTTLILICYIFPMLADNHLFSTKCLGSWKPKTLSPTVKYEYQTLRSCRPLRYKCGSLFFMRRYTAFKVISSVFYYTCKLLLIFNK